MAITLKSSIFESAMAIAPPLAQGVTPLGTEVSSTREPLWCLSIYTAANVPRLHLLQIVLEDMALICRVRHVSEILHDFERYFVTGVGGNHKVIWLTGYKLRRSPIDGSVTYPDGRLYQLNPRNFRVERSISAPAVDSSRNRPLYVGGDEHTVWLYSGLPRTGVLPPYNYSIYKLSASNIAGTQHIAALQTFSISGDRYGFWAIQSNSSFPLGQQIRLVFYDAGANRRLDIQLPLWEFGPYRISRKVHAVVGIGGKDPSTELDRALLFVTTKNGEGVRMHLLDTANFNVLRSTPAWRGQYVPGDLLKAPIIGR